MEIPKNKNTALFIPICTEYGFCFLHYDIIPPDHLVARFPELVEAEQLFRTYMAWGPLKLNVVSSQTPIVTS